MTFPEPILVIGGDSIIGQALTDYLIDLGLNVISTTRRPNLVCMWRPFFDLALEHDYTALPKKVQLVVLCAAIGDIAACRKHPEATRKINCTATLAIADFFYRLGKRTIFLSSSLVFDGSSRIFDELTPPTPITEVGRQKTDTERILLQNCPESIILRLSKVASLGVPTVEKWILKLMSHENVAAFSDFMVSPVSLKTATKVLAALMNPKIPGGIYQTSGAESISYYEWAKSIGCLLNVPRDLISPTLASEADPPLDIIPKYSVMEGNKVFYFTGIKHDHVFDVIEENFREYFKKISTGKTSSA